MAISVCKHLLVGFLTSLKRSHFLSFSVVSVCIVFLCIGLGFWQLQRLEWKTKLLHSVSDTNATSYTEFSKQETWQEFSKVLVTGTYLHDLDIRLEPRMRKHQLGAHLFSPLLTADGKIVYILRGWVGKASKAVSNVTTGTVYGVVFAPKKPGWFVPGNNIQAGEWHTINFDDIYNFVLLEKPDLVKNVAPFYVIEQQQLFQPNSPIPLEIKLNIRNDHLQYAITWFMLALCVLLMYARYAWKYIPVAFQTVGSSKIHSRSSCTH